ncbi:GPI mannosyltransferase 1 [Cyphellophora attinorum]|uniref:GPI mannosyltransferase 1 n=1 Tax=Cyphellophora attinorum TaxID=1664694 RepID=A0A0N0NM03_9EURO|nr:GPI mannosyltransferase 1 [Phialophora attinorum]KPI39639.1 GPI mannosyltransferase 1 [Phialophora attinorum]
MAIQIFNSPTTVFGLAFLLRLGMLLYGIYQDSVSAFKYTDVDYYVFTDAAAYVAKGQSPYLRATYRYTPLLSWILVPTTYRPLWFHSGKALFALSDLLAGWLLMRLLQRNGYSRSTSLRYASVWLLNPMVANISTRGSSEGLLCALILLTLYLFTTNQTTLSGILLGLSVHFKIYPFIYAPTFLLALRGPPLPSDAGMPQIFNAIISTQRTNLALAALGTFTILNLVMFNLYGPEFLQHTFLHHLTRLDHRHNFSVYNTLLYLSSYTPSALSIERLAFLPQLLLSVVLIPFSLATTTNPTTSLPATLLAQTLAFVTFNKVVTSQYFLWYLVFLPLYLPQSTFMRHPKTVGLPALGAWVVSQAVWLQQGYELEFLGKSTFVPGLWVAGLGFFAVNCWILGVVVGDVVGSKEDKGKREEKEKRKMAEKVE